MGSFSIWHWLIVLILIAAYIWPLGIIFKRIGKSPWWVVVGMIPGVGLPLLLWWIAGARWTEEGR